MGRRFVTTANVFLWGRRIGAVTWDTERGLGVFAYTPEFVGSGIELSPIEMPLRPGTFDFPSLPREGFKGLPGMLADSLPDKFGNALINRWLTEQGIGISEFDPVQRLCYVGQRGMGALEFEPAFPDKFAGNADVDIASLVALANRVLAERNNLSGVLKGQDDQHDLEEILRVGTSAGGARAKALIAWNERSGEFRSGQLNADPGFTQWLLKFDGVSGNSDKEVADPLGYGRLEYACYLMARDAGIEMNECRLFEEGGRAHFMTRRFDRTVDGGKLHMQSLCGLRHFDFNAARAYSYEQAIETIRLLHLPRAAREQMVRRALFNLVIRNQDDHTKNIAFLMNKSGTWQLAPAYDVVYAYNPTGEWTSQHQMSLSGKTDNFETEDIITFGAFADLKKRETLNILDQIQSAVSQWSTFCEAAGVPDEMATQTANGFRHLSNQ